VRGLPEWLGLKSAQAPRLSVGWVRGSGLRWRSVPNDDRDPMETLDYTGCSLPWPRRLRPGLVSLAGAVQFRVLEQTAKGLVEEPSGMRTWVITSLGRAKRHLWHGHILALA
jgi:hypothetical protein